jgi:hypothetical protein
MNEEEVVASALCDCRLWPGAWAKANEVERNAHLFEARVALRALDEYRWKKVDEHLAKDAERDVDGLCLYVAPMAESQPDLPPDDHTNRS